MPTMKPNQHPISVLDLLVLLGNLEEAKTDDRIGHLDADKTHDQLCRHLAVGRKIFVNKDVIESALAACNFRNEYNEFWHPREKTLETFTTELGFVLRRDYNLVRKK